MTRGTGAGDDVGSGGGTSGDVLVLRALGLGDAATGVAALRGVRRAWPDRRLVLAAPVPVGQWLLRLGLVDAVVDHSGVSPLAWSGTGHVAVNLHGRGPQSHRALLETEPAQLVAFACPAAGHTEGPRWRAEEHEVDRWCRLVRWAGGTCDPEDLRLPASTAPRTGQVVVHPGAASGARRWPVERWAWLVGRLAVAGHPVVVTGGPGEHLLCEQVAAPARSAGACVRTAAGSLDLASLTSLVARARLVVCGDTGVAHLATATATPSVLLFGPTPPQWWGPAIDRPLHTVLWHGTGPGDPHAAEVDPALAAITQEEVLQAVVEQLSQEPATSSAAAPR
ncbi:glycosyltransferase family 9 protein [Georgenia sp. 10Sc9-8]|uniref:Glycosyltransferase family 9 protein n=1 Tax=Georgenia halotolerans TaxID=3028317 RepID=A0ABT5U0T5_9MICO|nr:glycosyltransferase family 9 protein [Georgenia halotolerans]